MVRKIFQTNAELKDWLSGQNSAIIFIPTMGGLHPGHQYLIQKAKEKKNKHKPNYSCKYFCKSIAI